MAEELVAPTSEKAAPKKVVPVKSVRKSPPLLLTRPERREVSATEERKAVVLPPAPVSVEGAPYEELVLQQPAHELEPQAYDFDDEGLPSTDEIWRDIGMAPPVTEMLFPVPESPQVEHVEVSWAEVIQDEPEEICIVFAEALVAISDRLPAPHQEADTQVEQALPIQMVVAERLRQVEPEVQEEAKPMLVAIVEVVERIKTLDPLVVPAEVIELAHEELQEVCEELFELLAIEYDEETMEQFVAGLLHESFVPRRERVIEDNELTDVGTYETRVGASLLQGFQDWVDLLPLHQLLGRFVLLRHQARAIS